MSNRFRLAVALCAMPMVAQAECKGETLLSCPVGNGDYLEVCITQGAFSYAFGPLGAPELQLSVSMAAGTVTPWPGIGRAIWATVGFPNDGFVYEVWTSVERNPDAPAHSGGVNVLQGDNIIAEKSCIGGDLAPAFTLEDAMAANGFCWDFNAQTWREDGACGG